MRALKFLGFVVLFLGLLIYFAPKENIYYALEHKLSSFGVILSGEVARDTAFALKVENADIVYGGLEVGTSEEISVLTLLVYNAIEIKDVRISQSLKNMLGANIDGLSAKYTPFYPTKVWLKGKGEFGSLDGSYNIYSKRLYLVLEPNEGFSSKYPLIASSFKNIEGKLVYESSF